MQLFRKKPKSNAPATATSKGGKTRHKRDKDKTPKAEEKASAKHHEKHKGGRKHKPKPANAVDPDSILERPASPSAKASGSTVSPSVRAKALLRASKRMSLPGKGTGFFDMATYSGEVQDSDLDIGLRQHMDEALEMADKIHHRAHRLDGEHHPTADLEELLLKTYNLEGCYFIGHTNTDMDSIASAIAGAELFNGVATRSEREVNGEIEFACSYAKVDLPPYFDDVEGANDPNNETGIVLVDHNEPGQMIASLGTVAFPPAGVSQEVLQTSMKQASRIKGIIDHHALSDRYSSSHPLFVDIRPWGSACSILAHKFVRLGRPIPKHVCLVLLCGILSDTINLTSPTTTHADKVFATLLAILAEEHHPNLLAQEMFKAKTAHLTNLPAFSIVRADQKAFQMGEYLVGWATIEVNEPEKILAKSRSLLLELRVLKKEKDLDFAFLSVVDLEKMETKVLLCGELEVAIAKLVYGGETSNALDFSTEPDEQAEAKCSHGEHKHGVHDHGDKRKSASFSQLHTAVGINPEESLIDIGNKVSRKKEFIPPLKNLLAGGWKPSRQSVRIASGELAPKAHTEHVCVEGAGCSLHRTFSMEDNEKEAA
eukprot:CAMPEP_0184555666 /NCGR_PEP_ID=MMETSP0199_2-20130426/38048_1 /TAXON_ID=1112570 /ORGANISM="Thraustochytrium sp., Strain LLF1b" /LENGTH=598 /DNA_ID=CAMNT_0026952055 /DNA_START=173 /DNA_END=1969 /DNA_ORIENTATION=+